MKLKVRSLTVFALVARPAVICHARLGETIKELETRYGKPIKVQMDGREVTKWRDIKNLKDEEHRRIYQKGGFREDVLFGWGKAVRCTTRNHRNICCLRPSGLAVPNPGSQA